MPGSRTAPTCPPGRGCVRPGWGVSLSLMSNRRSLMRICWGAQARPSAGSGQSDTPCAHRAAVCLRVEVPARTVLSAGRHGLRDARHLCFVPRRRDLLLLLCGALGLGLPPGLGALGELRLMRCWVSRFQLGAWHRRGIKQTLEFMNEGLCKQVSE